MRARVPNSSYVEWTSLEVEWTMWPYVFSCIVHGVHKEQTWTDFNIKSSMLLLLYEMMDMLILFPADTVLLSVEFW